jgi:hypothetical protein
MDQLYTRPGSADKIDVAAPARHESGHAWPVAGGPSPASARASAVAATACRAAVALAGVLHPSATVVEV